MKDSVDLVCPCCSTRLVVETTTGEILSAEEPPKDHAKSFEQALSDVHGGSKKREDAFNKAFDRTQKLDDLLNKKFDEARKKAATDTSKPRNPFDLD